MNICRKLCVLQGFCSIYMQGAPFMVNSSHALKFEFILNFLYFGWFCGSGILCLCSSDHKEAVKFQSIIAICKFFQDLSWSTDTYHKIFFQILGFPKVQAVTTPGMWVPRKVEFLNHCLLLVFGMQAEEGLFLEGKV